MPSHVLNICTVFPKEELERNLIIKCYDSAFQCALNCQDVNFIVHEKGTLVEALYGVIYLEFGFQEVSRTLGLLQIR